MQLSPLSTHTHTHHLRPHCGPLVESHDYRAPCDPAHMTAMPQLDQTFVTLQGVTWLCYTVPLAMALLPHAYIGVKTLDRKLKHINTAAHMLCDASAQKGFVCVGFNIGRSDRTFRGHGKQTRLSGPLHHRTQTNRWKPENVCDTHHDTTIRTAKKKQLWLMCTSPE